MSTTTIPPEKAPLCDLESPHANVITSLPAWRSPTVWAAALVAVLGALMPFLAAPWDHYDQIALAVFAALGITGARAIGINAGTQGANRSPGDGGPKVLDAKKDDAP